MGYNQNRSLVMHEEYMNGYFRNSLILMRRIVENFAGESFRFSDVTDLFNTIYLGKSRQEFKQLHLQKLVELDLLDYFSDTRTYEINYSSENLALFVENDFPDLRLEEVRR